MGQLVCVRTYLNRPEAEILKSSLEANGIATMLSADDAGGMRPELTMSRGVKVWVHEEDKERAEELLQEMESQTKKLSNQSLEDDSTEKPKGLLTKIRNWLRG